MSEVAGDRLMGKHMGIDILPCPFCGVKPETQPSGENGRGLMIDCITANCVNPHTSYYDHATAIAVWNRRAPSPELTRYRQALFGGNVTAPRDDLAASQGPKPAAISKATGGDR